MNNRRILIFGRPGSGKTTLAVREMLSALNTGRYVYSNIDIHWFGNLYLLGSFEKMLNFLFKKFFGLFRGFLNKSINKLDIKYLELEELSENVIYTKGVPDVDLTRIFFDQYFIRQKIKRYSNFINKIDNGIIKSHYFGRERYRKFENLEEAVNHLISDAIENKKTREYTLVWDEGFIELEHGAKVPRYITNFLNQTRKLSVDVIISSQRPVAVYPSYRALCDYMVSVHRYWLFGTYFKANMYYADNVNALPDLDIEEPDKYDSWRGKEIFPYFDTKQSIGLKNMLSIK